LPVISAVAAFCAMKLSCVVPSVTLRNLKSSHFDSRRSGSVFLIEVCTNPPAPALKCL
jgi:hypothetical protein